MFSLSNASIYYVYIRDIYGIKKIYFVASLCTKHPPCHAVLLAADVDSLIALQFGTRSARKPPFFVSMQCRPPQSRETIPLIRHLMSPLDIYANADNSSIYEVIM
jgi:hypothetical protein